MTWLSVSVTIASWNAIRSGWSSRTQSARTDRRWTHAPCRPHRFSVRTRTSREWLEIIYPTTRARSDHAVEREV